MIGQVCFVEFGEAALLIPFVFIVSIAVVYLSLPLVKEARAYFEQQDQREQERIQDFRESGLMGHGVSNHQVEREIREFLHSMSMKGIDTQSLNMLFTSQGDIDPESSSTENSPLLT